MENLVKDLIGQGYLRNPEIINAFYRIKRRDFLPEKMKEKDTINAPLHIGYGQTNSQPLTVAFMLEVLEPQEGDRILDVGSGSGWQTALLADIVGDNGHVYGIERIAELKDFGEQNARKYNFVNITVTHGDGTKGLRAYAPYDKIIVAAAAQEIPQSLIDQLRVGGRLVIPVGDTTQDIIVLEKLAEDKIKTKSYPGFQFVPLISDNNI
ncbi:protein-L-isoaspartate O-methyltransferase, partial [Patescibacteria group bacterium]|nr:protein-L-isoaspartate O-methyltransferase [Patescibacteria group bacterium]